MAVSIQDIAKLRKLTGAGMMDVKKALEEAVGDFDKAIELLLSVATVTLKKVVYVLLALAISL